MAGSQPVKELARGPWGSAVTGAQLSLYFLCHIQSSPSSINKCDPQQMPASPLQQWNSSKMTSATPTNGVLGRVHWRLMLLGSTTRGAFLHYLTGPILQHCIPL